jgi:hypothetical protein
MKLAQALLLIPPGTHLRCGCERDPETGETFGSAALFEETPEDGWLDPRHSADKFLDRVIVGISTDEVDFEAFEVLTVRMIVKQYGTERQRFEAQEQLDRREQHEAQYVSSAAVKASW